MPDQQPNSQPLPTPTHERGDDELIAGRPLMFYVRALWPYAAALVVLEVVNIVFDVHRYGHWIIEVAVFAAAAWHMHRRLRSGFATMLAGAALVAVTVGLVLAVFDTAWYHHWWYILNLIRRPVMIGAVGLAVSAAVYLVSMFASQRTKGGGIYGGAETR
ncbi:MAG: hypothetical protein V1916_01720 [Patescibacteria group bacterium]